MRILLVNNQTQHLSHLKSALAGHQVEIQTYKPGINFHYQDKDLVILSGGGGEGQEIDDVNKPGKLWYEDEMNFVLSCPKPIIGICMGFEVIAKAYGQSVEELPGLLSGYDNISLSRKGRQILLHKKLKQFEAHKWRVTAAPSGFEVLADSGSGIEVISHKKRPLLATQFHPELGGTLSLPELVSRV
ncbi:MAG: gamma-glutamyl-gamma-aminobutyrate hydrolase family protein [Candidatus Saccharimonadales bacterium]